MTEVQGLAQMQRRFDRIPQIVREEVRATMEKTADDIVADMVAMAPKDQLNLANSIGWTWGEAPAGSLVIGSAGGDRAYGGLRITIYAGGEATKVTNSRGIEFDNARLQEFGTANMPANPYFFPIWRIWRRRMKARITAAMKRGLKKAST